MITGVSAQQLPAQSTDLHDHGGSSGSFTVLSGALTEAVPSADGIHDSVRPAGATVAFGPHYIHDVRNLATVPAVSVHVYSPPLTAMNFYSHDASSAGAITRIATLATEDPEPELRRVG